MCGSVVRASSLTLSVRVFCVLQMAAPYVQQAQQAAAPVLAKVRLRPFSFGKI
jgi:hypothetical protein